MREIIETNMSFSYIKDISDVYINIKDHQSRTIKCKNWDMYINYYLNPENDRLRELFPHTLPRLAEIINLKYDEYHLSCIIYNGAYLTYRLAYLKEDSI